MKDKRVKNDKLREEIKQFLAKNSALALATTKKNVPWACTLIYAFDKDFNLYFLSEKSSRHCQELEKNPKVAVAVHDMSGKMKGVQIQGKVSLVPKTKTPFALALFWKRFPWAKKNWVTSPKQLFAKAFKTALYQIRPERIYLLDKDKYGSEARMILNL